MPRRVTYTDPSTGRFVSATEAFDLSIALRRVYDGGLVEEQILNYGSIQNEDTAGAEPNWRIEDNKWGRSFVNDDESLDVNALLTSPPPDGVDAWRVRFTVAKTSEYAAGYAQSGWLDMADWPPSLDMLEDVTPTGIAVVHFRRT